METKTIIIPEEVTSEQLEKLFSSSEEKTIIDFLMDKEKTELTIKINNEEPPCWV